MSILLIDDELIIRKVGKRLLGRLGYSVLLANGGLEALELYKKQRDEVKLVVLDFVMPGMDGKQTFKELRKIDPHVKILFTSGCEKNQEIEELIAGGGGGFIQKPYDLGGLSNVMKSILL